MVSSDSCCPFVLVDQATENWSTCDAFVAQVRDGVGGLWWAKVTAAVRVPLQNLACAVDLRVREIRIRHDRRSCASDSSI